MTESLTTEFVRLLRFQILDARNGAISGEPDAIRLCGYAADEIERLQLLAADYGGQLTAMKAQLAELREDAAETVSHWGGYAGSYFQEKHNLAGDIARLRGSAPDVGGGG